MTPRCPKCRSLTWPEDDLWRCWTCGARLYPSPNGPVPARLARPHHRQKGPYQHQEVSRADN